MCRTRETEGEATLSLVNSGPVARALVFSDILGGRAAMCRRSSASPLPADEQAVRTVAAEIAETIEAVLWEQCLAQSDYRPKEKR